MFMPSKAGSARARGRKGGRQKRRNLLHVQQRHCFILILIKREDCNSSRIDINQNKFIAIAWENKLLP